MLFRSVNAQKDLPNPDNEFSLYGSAAHALADQCLTDGDNAIDYKGCSAVRTTKECDFYVTVPVLHESAYKIIPVDDEMMAGVQVYLDFCRNLKGDQEYVERKVFFGDAVPGNWGTADFIKVHTQLLGEVIREVNVVDLKFGKGVRVYAEENSQAMLYGTGVVDDLDFLFDFNDDDIVNVVIVQPRLDHIDEWQITVGDLRKWGQEIVKPAATLALKEDAPRVAGKHCTDGFCRRGKVGCKTQTAYNASLIHGDFTDVSAMVDAPLISQNDLTNDEIGMILPLLPSFYKWGKGLEAYAFDEKMAGREILNYKVVQGKPGNRYFIDEEKMMSWVMRKKLLKKKGDMKITKVMSPPGVEKAIKANGKKSDGLEKFWDKPEGKLTIAHVSDKRTEVKISSGIDDDFNNETLGV